MYSRLEMDYYSGPTGRTNALPALTRRPIGAIAMADQTLDAPEEWRPVPRHPAYEVSSLGRVRRVAAGPGVRPVPYILKQPLCRDGYPNVTLYGADGQRRYRTNRIVCEAFYGPPPSPAHQAAHNNGVRSDSRASNVRWATPSENMADCLNHGTHSLGERNPLAKLTEKEVLDIRLALSSGESQGSIARRFGVGQPTISKIARREAWNHVR
jgi:hypothetical protein